MFSDRSLSTETLFTYVNHHVLVALTQVMKHGRLVKVGQVAHIFGLLELGRVDLLALFSGQLFLK